MMWSCQLSTVLHTPTDSNGVVSEQSETISSLTVIKQWRYPPRWPRQRGIEWCAVAVIYNVIYQGLRVRVYLNVSFLRRHVKDTDTKKEKEGTIVESSKFRNIMLTCNLRSFT